MDLHSNGEKDEGKMMENDLGMPPEKRPRLAIGDKSGDEELHGDQMLESTPQDDSAGRTASTSSYKENSTTNLEVLKGAALDPSARRTESTSSYIGRIVGFGNWIWKKYHDMCDHFVSNRKYFVIDTNVLMWHLEELEKLKTSISHKYGTSLVLVIPVIVVDELESKKTALPAVVPNPEKTMGRSAATKLDLWTGIEDPMIALQEPLESEKAKSMRNSFCGKLNDDQVMNCALQLIKQNSAKRVCLVTGDKLMRLRARSAKILTYGFEVVQRWIDSTETKFDGLASVAALMASEQELASALVPPQAKVQPPAAGVAAPAEASVATAGVATPTPGVSVSNLKKRPGKGSQ